MNSEAASALLKSWNESSELPCERDQLSCGLPCGSHTINGVELLQSLSHSSPDTGYGSEGGSLQVIPAFTMKPSPSLPDFKSSQPRP